MNKPKVAAMIEGPTPTMVKGLQNSNALSTFIGASFVASALLPPHSHPPVGGPKHLKWNQAATKAFIKLKETFTTASIFRHPDLPTTFIVEVHASESEVAAVLSECVGEKPKLYPMAFLKKYIYI